jgi:hypothetical protein
MRWEKESEISLATKCVGASYTVESKVQTTQKKNITLTQPNLYKKKNLGQLL